MHAGLFFAPLFPPPQRDDGALRDGSRRRGRGPCGVVRVFDARPARTCPTRSRAASGLLLRDPRPSHLRTWMANGVAASGERADGHDASRVSGDADAHLCHCPRRSRPHDALALLPFLPLAPLAPSALFPFLLPLPPLLLLDHALPPLPHRFVVPPLPLRAGAELVGAQSSVGFDPAAEGHAG